MNMRKVMSLLLVAFAVFFVVQYPVDAAQIVRGTFQGARDLLGGAANSLSTFLQQLF